MSSLSSASKLVSANSVPSPSEAAHRSHAVTDVLGGSDSRFVEDTAGARGSRGEHPGRPRATTRATATGDESESEVPISSPLPPFDGATAGMNRTSPRMMVALSSLVRAPMRSPVVLGFPRAGCDVAGRLSGRDSRHRDSRDRPTSSQLKRYTGRCHPDATPGGGRHGRGCEGSLGAIITARPAPHPDRRAGRARGGPSPHKGASPT